jgi:hypothetical protein
MGPEDNPRDDTPADREEYEKWAASHRECSCECWRCIGGGHCVRCDFNDRPVRKLRPNCF